MSASEVSESTGDEGRSERGDDDRSLGDNVDGIGGGSGGNIGGFVLQRVKAELGPAVWSAKLSDTERELLATVSNDAANVLLLAAGGASWEAARERAQVEAQLANFASVGTARVSRAVWSAVAEVARAALAIVLA